MISPELLIETPKVAGGWKLPRSLACPSPSPITSSSSPKEGNPSDRRTIPFCGPGQQLVGGWTYKIPSHLVDVVVTDPDMTFVISLSKRQLRT